MARYKSKHNWPVLIAELKASGMTKSDFCKQKGIATSGLYRALGEHGQAKSFIKVKTKPTPEIIPSCTIELPNKVRITLHNPTATLLTALIK